MKLPELSQRELEFGEVASRRRRNFVLSVRNRSTHGFLGVRESAARARPKHCARARASCFYALMDAVVDRYFRCSTRSRPSWNVEERDLRPRCGALEHRAAVRAEAARDRDAPRGRAAGRSRRQATSGPRAGGVREHAGILPRRARPSRPHQREAIDAMRETIATAIQVNLSMVTIEESETTKRLAAWAAIFAVSTALAGVRGMNFDSMPELHWRWGYPMALARSPPRPESCTTASAAPVGCDGTSSEVRPPVGVRQALVRTRRHTWLTTGLTRRAAPRAAGGVAAPRSAQDLLRRVGRRRQDLRDAFAAARAARAQGTSLIVGVVETHGRAETEAMVHDLPRLALKPVPYRDRVLQEFDLDGALAWAAPQPEPLVLLDELAHSNARLAPSEALAGRGGVAGRRRRRLVDDERAAPGRA